MCEMILHYRSISLVLIFFPPFLFNRTSRAAHSPQDSNLSPAIYLSVSAITVIIFHVMSSSSNYLHLPRSHLIIRFASSSRRRVLSIIRLTPVIFIALLICFAVISRRYALLLTAPSIDTLMPYTFVA